MLSKIVLCFKQSIHFKTCVLKKMKDTKDKKDGKKEMKKINLH